MCLFFNKLSILDVEMGATNETHGKQWFLTKSLKGDVEVQQHKYSVLQLESAPLLPGMIYFTNDFHDLFHTFFLYFILFIHVLFKHLLTLIFLFCRST